MNIDLAKAIKSQFLEKKNVDRKPDAREIEFITLLLHGSEWEDQEEAKAVLEVLITIATHDAFDRDGDGGLANQHIIRLIAFVAEAVGLLEPIGVKSPNET